LFLSGVDTTSIAEVGGSCGCVVAEDSEGTVNDDNNDDDDGDGGAANKEASPIVSLLLLLRPLLVLDFDFVFIEQEIGGDCGEGGPANKEARPTRSEDTDVVVVVVVIGRGGANREVIKESFGSGSGSDEDDCANTDTTSIPPS